MGRTPTGGDKGHARDFDRASLRLIGGLVAHLGLSGQPVSGSDGETFGELLESAGAEVEAIRVRGDKARESVLVRSVHSGVDPRPAGRG